MQNCGTVREAWAGGGASTCGAQLADNTNSRFTFDDNGDDDDRCVEGIKF